MWCRGWMVPLAVLAVGVVGCGGADESGQGPAGGNAGARSQTGAGEDSAAKPSGPAAAVREFLEAVRAGDDQKAALMLTKTARQKTAELNIEVAPPGSDTAQFEVGQVQLLDKDRAQVAATWSDLDGNSQRRKDEVTWVLRREPEGWRIGGVAASVFEDQPPLLLNFEDPEEMLRKQQWVQEQMRRRAQPEDRQAQGKETSQDSIRR